MQPILITLIPHCVLNELKQDFSSSVVDDGGGPPGIGIQVLVSNRLQVLSPKAMVLSVLGKG